MELVKERTRINIKLDKITGNMPQIFKEIPGVSDAAVLDDTVTLFGENGDILLAEIISRISEEKSKIRSLDIQKPDLEAVFLHLTGKALRD